MRTFIRNYHGDTSLPDYIETVTAPALDDKAYEDFRFDRISQQYDDLEVPFDNDYQGKIFTSFIVSKLPNDLSPVTINAMPSNSLGKFNRKTKHFMQK